jgi:hypothetical protein
MPTATPKSSTSKTTDIAPTTIMEQSNITTTAVANSVVNSTAPPTTTTTPTTMLTTRSQPSNNMDPRTPRPTPLPPTRMLCDNVLDCDNCSSAKAGKETSTACRWCELPELIGAGYCESILDNIDPCDSIFSVRIESKGVCRAVLPVLPTSSPSSASSATSIEMSTMMESTLSPTPQPTPSPTPVPTLPPGSPCGAVRDCEQCVAARAGLETATDCRWCETNGALDAGRGVCETSKTVCGIGFTAAVGGVCPTAPLRTPLLTPLPTLLLSMTTTTSAISACNALKACAACAIADNCEWCAKADFRNGFCRAAAGARCPSAFPVSVMASVGSCAFTLLPSTTVTIAMSTMPTGVKLTSSLASASLAAATSSKTASDTRTPDLIGEESSMELNDSWVIPVVVMGGVCCVAIVIVVAVCTVRTLKKRHVGRPRQADAKHDGEVVSQREEMFSAMYIADGDDDDDDDARSVTSASTQRQVIYATTQVISPTSDYSLAGLPSCVYD